MNKPHRIEVTITFEIEHEVPADQAWDDVSSWLHARVVAIRQASRVHRVVKSDMRLVKEGVPDVAQQVYALLESVAGQQAMPDDSWKSEWRKILPKLREEGV
jgi:hypothetical protein